MTGAPIAADEMRFGCEIAGREPAAQAFGGRPTLLRRIG